MADSHSVQRIPTSPIYPRNLTLIQRIQSYLHIHLMKIASTLFLQIPKLPPFIGRSILPTLTKNYPQRPSLVHRVYIPKSYKSGDALLPLYLHMHGGGFALMSPVMDDRFGTAFANDNKFLVISVDYPKSPANPYPAAVNQLTEVIKAILDDDSLPIDKTKVAIGGSSAGANLALAVSQDPDLRKRIGGIVAYYPPVDWTTSLEHKLATRPQHAGTDPLEDKAISFDWAYIPKDRDLRDAQLSVTFAPRETLPAKIYIIGCEFDLLCRDSEVMAESLASYGSGERIGNDVSWEQNGIKWEKVIGFEHGFDVTPVFNNEAKKTRVEKRTRELYESTAEWLIREVYA